MSSNLICRSLTPQITKKSQTGKLIKNLYSILECKF